MRRHLTAPYSTAHTLCRGFAALRHEVLLSMPERFWRVPTVVNLWQTPATQPFAPATASPSTKLGHHEGAWAGLRLHLVAAALVSVVASGLRQDSYTFVMLDRDNHGCDKFFVGTRAIPEDWAAWVFYNKNSVNPVRSSVLLNAAAECTPGGWGGDHFGQWM